MSQWKIWQADQYKISNALRKVISGEAKLYFFPKGYELVVIDFTKNEKLDRVKIIFNENKRVNYCCLNSSNIIEVFGRSDVSNKLIQSSCNKNT